MPADRTNRPTLALIGFGEAGTAFAGGWKPLMAKPLAAFDIKTTDEATREAKRADYAEAGVEGCETAGEAIADADVVFSFVTADQAFAAAASVAGALSRPTLFMDCNSCSPQTKQRSAAAIEAAGGRYVDVAVMAPVRPRGHQTPLLVSGDHAAAALAAMEAMEMNAKEAPGPVGTASAIKLSRSVMIKGLEALMSEYLLTARALGVEETVFDTLYDTFPGFDWRGEAAIQPARMVVHGTRRAAEMDAAAEMVEELGLPSEMSRGAAAWERRIGALDIDLPEISAAHTADALLAPIRRKAEGD